MKAEPGLQETKSKRTREAIAEATIESLVKMGYAETSLSRVAKLAGFSKGALQHHFSSKEDLVAATLDTLLERTFQPRAHGARAETVEEALMFAWTRFINTAPYRALMEILIAARTDDKLQARISKDLVRWGRRIDRQSLEHYEAVSGDKEEVIMLLNMNRSFLRGLLLQEQYGVSKKKTEQYVEKWIQLIAPLLKLRSRD